MLILAADIDGTRARLLLARGADDDWQTLRQQTLAGQAG